LTYSEKYKEKLITKALSDAQSIASVAKSSGVPTSTLYSWVRQAKVYGMSKPKPSKRRGRPRKSNRFSPEEKLRILIESSALEENALGAYLRKEGLHDSDLAQMRSDALSGLTPKVVHRGKSPTEKKIARLEKDLSRKDKALAEAAALLVLQKKFQALMAAEGDDTDEDFGDDS
jgi:transposase-like protein